jgi:hypothetical protein
MGVSRKRTNPGGGGSKAPRYSTRANPPKKKSSSSKGGKSLEGLVRNLKRDAKTFAKGLTEASKMGYKGGKDIYKLLKPKNKKK